MKSFFILIIFITFSCKEAVKEVVKATKPESVLEGQYYDIKNYPIKLFLPKGYKNIERYEILKQAQNIENEFLRKQLVKSIENQIQNNIDKQYLFSDGDGSSISLAEIPYMPLSIEIASQILGMIQMESQQLYEQTDLRRILIDKRFKGNKSLKFFKAIYKTETTIDSQTLGYFHLYVLEIKNRLFVINLEVPYEANYEPYFLKTRIY